MDNRLKFRYCRNILREGVTQEGKQIPGVGRPGPNDKVDRGGKSPLSQGQVAMGNEK
jgi:hypothetical protein